MQFTGISLLLMYLIGSAYADFSHFKQVFAWKEIDYEYQSEEERAAAIEKGEFIQGNSLPQGIDVYENKLFITTPRWKTGVPSSLNYVMLDSSTSDRGLMCHLGKGATGSQGSDSPKLIPYPNLSANKLPEGENADMSTIIVSAYHIQVDPCKRLWVMDTGCSEAAGLHSNPKILVYDLTTDILLRSYTLPDKDLVCSSFLTNIIVDVDSEDCDNAFAYLADTGGTGLVVYSWKKNESWRIEHHYLNFDPLHGNFTIGGINYRWNYGIYGLALSPYQQGCSRILYVHPLCSDKEFAACTKTLQDKESGEKYSLFNLVGSRGINYQSSASVVSDKTCIMFYTLLNKNAIGCWNIMKPYSVDHRDIVAEDHTALVYPSDLRVDNSDNLWVLSDKLPLFRDNKLDPEDINYRVFVAPVKDIISGTACENILHT